MFVTRGTGHHDVSWILPSGFRPDLGFGGLWNKLILPWNDLILTCVLRELK